MEKLDVQCLNNVVIFTPMHQDIYNSMKPCFFTLLKKMYFCLTIILLIGGNGMVSAMVSDLSTCSKEDCCQEVLFQVKCLTQKINELTNQIKNKTGTSFCTRNTSCTRDPFTIGCPKKIIIVPQPKSIYITDDGKVFVSGYGDGYIHKFDKNGDFQKKFGVPNCSPAGLYVKDKQLYVVCSTTNTIYEYTTDGEFIGVKVNQKNPSGLAVDSDNKFYVSELSTATIHVYNSDGNKSHVITSVGTYPRKIQFDSNDNLRVLTHYNRVHIITKAGIPLCQLAINGLKFGEGLFVDCDDNMYIADRGSPGVVFICDKNGKPIKVITGFDGASDVAIGIDGTVWITDFIGNKVYLY